MKRLLAMILACLLLALAGCAEKPSGKSVMEQIEESPAAKLLRQDGTEILVDSEIALLRGFSALRLHVAPLEPADKEADWLYRIVFNPAKHVREAPEITVSFHKDYVQVGREYYVPDEDVTMDSILEWAAGKCDYFFK